VERILVKRMLMHQKIESLSTDPNMVVRLIQAMGSALDRAVVPEVTTTSDILTAVLTLLDRTLRISRQVQDPKDSLHNSQEVERVLIDMIMEFGNHNSTIH
jgi:hypothetical protein